MPAGAIPPPPPPPAYGGAPVYAGQGYGAPPAAGTNGMAIASLVLGIIGVISCGYTFFVAPVLAIIFGVIGRRQIRERGQQGNGLAIAGLSLGIIGVVISLVWVLFVILAVTSGSTRISTS